MEPAWHPGDLRRRHPVACHVGAPRSATKPRPHPDGRSGGAVRSRNRGFDGAAAAELAGAWQSGSCCRRRRMASLASISAPPGALGPGAARGQLPDQSRPSRCTPHPGQLAGAAGVGCETVRDPITGLTMRPVGGVPSSSYLYCRACLIKSGAASFRARSINTSCLAFSIYSLSRCPLANLASIP